MKEFEKKFLECEKDNIEKKIINQNEINSIIENYLQKKEELELELKEINNKLEDIHNINISLPNKMVNSDKVKRVVDAVVKEENGQYEMKCMKIKYYLVDCDSVLETPYFIRIDDQDNLEYYDSFLCPDQNDNHDLYISLVYDLNDINLNDAWNSIKEFVIYNNCCSNGYIFNRICIYRTNNNET